MSQTSIGRKNKNQEQPTRGMGTVFTAVATTMCQSTLYTELQPEQKQVHYDVKSKIISSLVICF